MKSYTLLIKQEAREEIIDAYKWYESKQRNLGVRFIDTLDVYFNRIETTPKTFPKVLNTIRQSTIKEFPFIIMFEIEKNSIIVYAVFNTNQNPKNWKERIYK